MPTETKVGGVSPFTRELEDVRSKSGRRIGGVHRKTGHEQYPVPVAPVPAAPAHGDLVWNGGPVLTCPFMYATFWGPSWTNSPAGLAEAARLSQFLQDLGNSQFMNILSQYGVGSGPGTALFLQASFITNVAANVSDADIHNIIQGAINSGAIPEPPANNKTHCIIIFLDSSIAVRDTNLGITMCEPGGDTAFGYHFFFNTAKGNSCYYSVIPSLDDNCLRNTGCGGGGCSLSLSQTQEQRRTQVTSHELAEMATDPAFPSGWFGNASDEVGDICNGEADSITVGANTWDVQRIYSKTDDIATNGASFCRVTAPNPIPKLSPGPSAVAAALTSAQHFGRYDGFLPLPNVFYDAKSKETTWDNKEVERYSRRFFYPFHPDNVHGNFGAVLRQFADILEGKKK